MFDSGSNILGGEVSPNATPDAAASASNISSNNNNNNNNNPGSNGAPGGNSNVCCWRNMFSCINLVRVLNKLCKWKHSRIMMLVVFKSAPILKRTLMVSHLLLN